MRRLKPSYIFAAAYLTAHAAVLAALNEILDWLLLALSAVLFAELLDERAGAACFAVQRWSLTVVIIYLDWALCSAALYLRRRLSRTYKSE